MGKHTDKLGTLDDFKAPWQTEAGEDAEIDKPKLRRLIFNLKLGEAKALDAKAEADEAVEKAEKDLEEAKAQAADSNGAEAQKAIDKLQKKLDDVTAERDKLVSDKEQADLRKQVLGDLPEKYAKYVTGTTEEELEESLKAVKEDFGLEESGEEEEEEEEPPVRTTPRAVLKNGTDRQSGKPGDEPIDFDKAADDILVGGVFR